MASPKRKRLDEKRLAAALIIANEKLEFENDEKAARAAELVIANEKLDFENDEKAKRAAELVIASIEKAARAAELLIANEKLDFETDEKAKRAAELVIASIEKAARAAELLIANEKLDFETDEKAKRADELVVANIEKAARAAELVIANELVNINLELEISRNEATIANKAKSDFLAAMSHDLRTPLNAIMGFADIMRLRAFGPLGDPHYEEYANDIYNSGFLLLRLINDVLDLSKIEAGKYELVEEPLDIHALIETSFKQFGHTSKASTQTLSSDIVPDIPFLLADERVMIQILNNLLSNAIKFTPAGGVINVTKKFGENNGIILSVTDTGVGMSKADMIKALKPFEQADVAHSRRHEGTGLGLHLCANFMKLFGGALSIESEVDCGTKVTLEFPPERTILPS
ncbi:MAG: signal transduction histidine kinase [Paracoccaceae bacterium]|jgi:signal transduction histidine kinase